VHQILAKDAAMPTRIERRRLIQLADQLDVSRRDSRRFSVAPYDRLSSTFSCKIEELKRREAMLG